MPGLSTSLCMLSEPEFATAFKVLSKKKMNVGQASPNQKNFAWKMD